MPKLVQPQDRKVPVSIKMRYVSEALNNGCVDIEGYIEMLKERNAKLQAAVDSYVKDR